MNEHEIIKKHQDMVTELVKPGSEILASMTPEKFRVWVRACANAAIAEATLSAAKKHVIYEAELPLRMQDWTNKDGLEIVAVTSTPQQIDLLHAATGIATEALELLKATLNYIAVGQLDFDNFIEELGDLEFYMEQARQNQQINRNETLLRNHTKLRKRYSEGYTNEAAINRADKQEEQ